ncbi:MAG: T9SS type A sorting domain-containing protein [Ignavibacteria bacterium]|nr:T9SS type A sorting domain-containing protein [Ignavibacteria bacterium]
MIRYILLVFVFLSWNQLCNAQIWTRTNGPTTGNVNAFASGQNGYLYAAFGPLYAGNKSSFSRSTNNGATWSYTQQTFSSYAYDMIVKNNIIYVATDGGIIKSTDNGVTFSGFAFTQTNFSIFSNSATNNFFTGNNTQGIFKSSNAGVSWYKVLDSTGFIRNITGDDSSYIFASGNSQIYRSSDAGESWDSILNITSFINCIKYVTGGVMYAGTDSGLYRSQNYGSNWTLLTTPFRKVSSVSIDINSGLMIGSNDGIWYSDNSGLSWNVFTSILRDVREILIAPTIILAGTTHGIFRSTNSGVEWLSSGIRNATIVDIDARTHGKIHALSPTSFNTHALWRSTNEGNLWVNVYTTSFFITKVASFDSNIYLGTPTGVLRSSNNGISFQEVFSTGNQCRKILTDSAGTVFAAFGNGLFKSTNSGLNWTNVANINHIVYDMYIVNQSLMYVCGFGKIYRSTDGGNDMTLILNQGQDFVNIAATSNGYVIVDGPGVYRSSNFGQNWTSLGYPQSVVIDHFIFDKGNNFYFLLGDDIYKSTDYGTTSDLFNSGLPGNITCIGLNSGNRLFVGIDGGSVYRTISPVTEIVASNIIPKQYYLHQNYPNPFNPVTKINFDLASNTENVKHVIDDVTGKEVSILANEMLTAGSYEVVFDGKELPSGVYFCKLTAGNFWGVKRMVLLK